MPETFAPRSLPLPLPEEGRERRKSEEARSVAVLAAFRDEMRVAFAFAGYVKPYSH